LVTTHFKKLTTETTCLLSQLFLKKLHLTVFTSNFQCVCLAARRCIEACDATDQWRVQPKRCGTLPHLATTAFFSWLTIVNRQHW